MTCGSLFSGAGGFDLGLEAAGMRTLWMVEIDRQCRSVLRRHWPDAALHDDVRGVGRHNLEPVDLVCGGFPCQDLSVAGRRAGLAGERSGLFHEFMRVVAELAPRWVLIENVPGLLSSNDGRDMGTVLGTLGQLGYGWAYRVLDSRHFGVPQRRRRVFIVGRAGGFCPPEVLFEPACLPGDPAAGGEAGQGVTAGITARVGNASRPAGGNGNVVAGTVAAKWAKGTGGPAGDEAQNLVAAPLTTKPHADHRAQESRIVVAGQCQGSNVGEMGTLRRGNGNVTGGVPFIAHTLRAEAVRTETDDGVTQTAAVRQGIALVDEAKVPNPVRLAPWRTFEEVGQPLSPFVFRIQKPQNGNGKMQAALFEADGGAWRRAASTGIYEWLEGSLGQKVAILA